MESEECLTALNGRERDVLSRLGSERDQEKKVAIARARLVTCETVAAKRKSELFLALFYLDFLRGAKAVLALSTVSVDPSATEILERFLRANARFTMRVQGMLFVVRRDDGRDYGAPALVFGDAKIVAVDYGVIYFTKRPDAFYPRRPMRTKTFGRLWNHCEVLRRTIAFEMEKLKKQSD